MTKAQILLMILLFTAFGKVTAQSWLGKIVPMQTQKPELAEILKGYKPEERRDTLVYKLTEGNLFITLSSGKCIAGTWGAWNIDKDFIVHVTFYPAKRRTLAQYSVDSKRFEKRTFHGSIYLSDPQTGVMFTLSDGKVDEISSAPARQYSDLKCPKEAEENRVSPAI